MRLKIPEQLRSFFKKTHPKRGFSLVEMIVYVAIFSILFTVILNLFWRIQLSGSRVQIANEVKENSAQVLQLMTSAVREGDSLNTGSSVFDSHPGVLIINDDETLTFDSYEKEIMIGERAIIIRKLRLTQGANPALDLTSDYVTVTNYQINDLSQSDGPETVQVQLTVSSINPDNDLDYHNILPLRTSLTFRNES